MFFVAIGGLVGSLLRYLLNELSGSDLTGVLIANLIGVFVAAFVVVYSTHHPNEKLRHFLLPGFCGGLTTFSSLILLSDAHGYFYLLKTLLLSVLVIAISVPLARKVIETQ
jgi:CrcB protein